MPIPATYDGAIEQDIVSWRNRLSGMAAADVKEVKNLTQENARLNELLAFLNFTATVSVELAA